MPILHLFPSFSLLVTVICSLHLWVCFFYVIFTSLLYFLQPHGLYHPWNSLGQNTGMGSLSLFQGIFPTQGSNPGLLHCRHILYQLSHQGSPRILEWVAYPFSSGSTLPRNWTRVFFTKAVKLVKRILYQLSYEGSPHLWCLFFLFRILPNF